jgi:uncharacterized membrane protein
MPERSFFYKGKQFPVCARCTGVFIGQLIAAVLFWYIKPTWWVITFCLLIMFVDWLIQYTGINESTNIRRLITGFMGGYAVLSVEFSFLIMLIEFLRGK